MEKRFSVISYARIITETTMSTLLYKALIEADVSETTATDAAEELDNYKVDVTSLRHDVTILKTKVDTLLIGVGLLIALGIFDKFL